jgi:hypothetical protein
VCHARWVRFVEISLDTTAEEQIKFCAVLGPAKRRMPRVNVHLR